MKDARFRRYEAGRDAAVVCTISGVAEMITELVELLPRARL